MRLVTMLLAALFVLALGVLGAHSAIAQPASDVGGPTPPETPSLLSPSWETDIDNGDGTRTFTQGINANSTPPHYLGPFATNSVCGQALFALPHLLLERLEVLGMLS